MTCPIAVSSMNKGTPNIAAEIKYGIRKAPPPHENTK